VQSVAQCVAMIINFIKEKYEAKEIPLEKIFPMQEINVHKELMKERILEKFGEEIEYEDDDQLYFHLPREGTVIKLSLILGADEITVPILRLEWNKSTFYIEEKYEEVNPEI